MNVAVGTTRGARASAGAAVKVPMARKTPLGAGILVAALLVAACSAAPHGGGSGPVSPQVTTAVTDWLFPGSVAQAKAGVAFDQTLTNLRSRKFEACLAGFGFDGKAQQFALAAHSPDYGGIPVAPGYIPPGYLSDGLVDLRLIRHTGMLVPIRIGNKLAGSGSGISPAEEAATFTKSIGCSAMVSRLYSPLEGGAVNAMQVLWLNAVTRLQESAAVQAANLSFGQCVTAHGAPQTAGESLLAFWQWLKGAVNGTGYISTEPLTPPQQVRHLDAHWTLVFAHCATPVVTAMERRLPALQKSFLQSHFQQISSADEKVAHVLADLEHAK